MAIWIVIIMKVMITRWVGQGILIFKILQLRPGRILILSHFNYISV